MKTIKKDLIENAAIYYAMKIVMDDEVVEKLADKVMNLQGKENTNIPLLKKQLSDTQKSIDNIIRAIEQGVLTSSTKQRLDELEEEKSQLEISLIQEEMQKPLLTREQVVFWIRKFREFDLEELDHRQRLIDSFINAIYVYDDKVVFTFNYKDGSKTVSMADIKGSDLKGFGAPKSNAYPDTICIRIGVRLLIKKVLIYKAFPILLNFNELLSSVFGTTKEFVFLSINL